MPKQAKGKSRFWRLCRIYFRRFRIAVWSAILLLLGVLIYLNLVGVPDFIKRPLQQKIQEHGLALEFAGLKLYWSRGFVAEQVRFGASAAAATNAAIPRLTAQELEVDLHLRALFQARFQVDAVMLRGAKLEWNLTQSNAPSQVLTIDDIETSVRFLPEDQWQVDDLHGSFYGAKFFLTGSLKNASEARDWQFITATNEVAGRWATRLRRFADVMERVTFEHAPELRLDLQGDARDVRSLSARLTAKADDADTAWGRAKQVLFMAQLFALGTNDQSRAEFSLMARQVETRWATVTNLDTKLRLISALATPDQIEAVATLRADEAVSPWAALVGTQIKANWSQSLTNFIPPAARLEFHVDKATGWLTVATNVNASVAWAGSTNSPAPQLALGVWTNLLPYQIRWNASAGAVRSLFLQAAQIAIAGDWQPPQLNLESFSASLYRGSVQGRAALDVVTRATTVAGISDFELKAFAPLLNRSAQEWLSRFSWKQPPQFSGEIAAVLPPWNATDVDWATTLRPTLRIAGSVAATNVSYLGVFADWLTTDVQYRNEVLELPNFRLGRPEGGLELVHRADERSGEFYCKLQSGIDVQAVLPLLDPEARKAFDPCEFGQPPQLAGELWGRWSDADSIGFRGSLTLTNFAFRGQRMDSLVTGLTYTNLIIECLQPFLSRGTQHLSADGIRVDLNTHRTHLTNLVGTFEPAVLVNAIGPQVAHVMEPYHFLTPPTARVNGYVPMGNPHDADVVFEGGGHAFESLHFRATDYKAKIIWKNNLLTVTNATGDFYGGKATGWAHFVFPDLEHAQYAFAVEVAGARLPALLYDQTKKTNNVDGLLTGQLVVTNAWTDNVKTWNGYGQATLRDGLLWELPVFGVLSGALDSMMPGIGKSRFTEAKGTFGITDGVFYSPDLEMRSSTMRLQYKGAVDFDGNLSARVYAEPLRDTPVVGPVVSSILTPVARLFAYRITGTLADPKSEPVNIPAPMMYLFSPFQSLGDLFSNQSAKTNSSPASLERK